MFDSEKVTAELFDRCIKELSSDSICKLADAAAMLGESANAEAIQPLLQKANTATDWLIQDFFVRALMELSYDLREADTALKKIVLIEPPESDRVLEIEQTFKSPYIYFDLVRGKLIFWGKGSDSIIAREILKSLFSEFELFDKLYPDKPLIASFCMKHIYEEYDRGFWDFFKRIQRHPNTIVYWHYELLGDRMTLMGESYADLFPGIKFIFLDISRSDLYYDY